MLCFSSYGRPVVKGENLLKVNLLEKPQGLTLEKYYHSTYHLRWKTSLADIGKHKVRIQVEDESGLKTEKTLIIEIKENKAPEIIIKDSKYEYVVGNLLEFFLSVEDKDSDPKQFSLKILNAPSGMYMNRGLWAGDKIKWTPKKDQIGIHKVIFQVIDEFGRKIEEKLTLTIK